MSTMDRRLVLQTLLESIPDVVEVYFQPPENLKMEYPCIVYNLDFDSTEYADNIPYANTDRWSVTVIDGNPDTKVRHAVKALPMCSLNRVYPADNLNHFVYTLYF